MAIFRFLQPAPYKETIQDPEKIKTLYHHWRWRIFYSMYLGYATFYLTRKSLTSILPSIRADLSLDMCDFGLVSSVFALTYGLSKFTSGMIADRSNPRYFMALGLGLTALMHAFLGLSSSVLAFTIFWGLNGWFQGFAWPGCARLLTHWYSHSERGHWWGLWNTSHSVGGALTPLICSFLAEHYGWRVGLLFPGIFGLIIAFFLVDRLRDTPQSLGLPTVESYKEKQKEVDEQELSSSQILFDYVLTNPRIWALAFAYAFLYFVRTAIDNWIPTFLVESQGYSQTVAGACAFWFEVGGFLGSLSAGVLSDRFFHGRRGPINVLYCCALAPLAYGFFAHWLSGFLFNCVLMFLYGFFIFGPQMLIGVAAAELSHKKAAATATGFIGLLAYLGSAAAGQPLSYLIAHYGWDDFFIALGISSVLSVLFLLPLWNQESAVQKKSA